MAESRVNLTKREYEIVMSKGIMFDILIDGIVTQDQLDQAYTKLRELAGEPVLESTVNTPLIGDPTD